MDKGVKSRTNIRWLSSHGTRGRLQALQTEKRILERKVHRLTSTLEHQLATAVTGSGIALDSDLHHDLLTTIQEMNHKALQGYAPDSFPRLFWESQQKAAALADSRSMRWHPLMIKWCIYLRHLSSTSYETLRQSGVVHLPSQRTLRDYTHCIPATSGIHCTCTCTHAYVIFHLGFSASVDKLLAETAKIDSCVEREKWVLLLMDEMRIKENLVFDKHTGMITEFWLL